MAQFGPEPGATTKLNEPGVRETFLAALTDGASYTGACRAIGVHKETFYGWRKKGEQGIEPYASFVAEVDAVLADLERRLSRRWQELAEDDPRALQEFLARRFKEDWSPTFKQEIEAKVDYTHLDAADVRRRLLLDAHDRAEAGEDPRGGPREGPD